MQALPVVVQCCFCGTELCEEEPGLVTLIVAAVPRAGTEQPHAQQLWSHARCLGTRLHQSIEFDTGRFED
jgi:hypothetical protein